MSDYRRHLAWNAGYKAGQAGKPREKNNRQPGTIFYDDWADGWEDGDHDRRRKKP